MKPGSAILEQTPSLHKWLGRQLSCKGITQRELAMFLGRSNSQVNHWLSGKEPIPRALFLQAVSSAVPEALTGAGYLLHAHEHAKLLQKAAAKIVSDSGDGSPLAVAKTIGRRAEESAVYCDVEDTAFQYQFLSEYVAAGLIVLNMIKACKEDKQPFINSSNIRLHLRFPHNVMTSDLIQFGAKNPRCLEEARAVILKSMTQSITTRYTGKYADHVRQHAFHILARCGDDHNRALVFELTQSRKDLATRRTAHYARIINEPNPQAAEQFIYELEREPALAAFTLDFDLVHYGDKGLEDSTPLKSVENVIVHNLRHIQTHQSAATAQIALQKLLSILNQFGGRPFDRRRIYPRIRTILDRFQSMDLNRLTHVERKFMNHFWSLQVNSASVLEQVPSASNQMTFGFL
jgi:transcriptional regulator with XRE-family HTH domain